MHKRWYMAIAGLLVMLAGAALAWRWYDREMQLRGRVAEWEGLEDTEARLLKMVDLQGKDSKPLEFWIDEFTRHTKLSIVFHGKPDLISQTEGTFSWGSGHIPAHQVLDILAGLTSSNWRVDDSGVIGFYPYDSGRIPPTIREYSLDQSLPPKQIATIVRSMVEPDSWSDVGGPGELIASPGHLLIAQRRDLHERICDFLDRLQPALHQAAELPAVGLSPDDLRLQSIPLTMEAIQFERTHAALEQRVSFDFVDKPLKDCISHLVDTTGVTIVIPRRLEAYDFRPDEPVTLKVDDIRLKTALRLLLNPQGGSFTTGSDGSILKVVTFDQERSPENMVDLAYPIPDFGGPSEAEQLSEILNSEIEGDSWKDVGGPGSIERIGNVLVISQSQRTQARIREFLRALRNVRSGQQSWARAQPSSPDREETFRQLQQPLELKYKDFTLKEFFADLAKRTELRFALTPSIWDIGLNAESTVSCDLPTQPLADNLYAALAHYELSYEVREDCVAITTEDYVNSPDHLEIEIVDIRPLSPRVPAEKLISLLRATVEPNRWSTVGGPGTLHELQGLLVVQHRPEVLRQVRYVLSIIEEQLPRTPTTSAATNLIQRQPFDSTDLPIRLYVINDLLKPIGGYSKDALIRVLHVSKIRRFEKPSFLDIPHLEVHVNRFLVAYLHDDHIEPLEAKLRELREK